MKAEDRQQQILACAKRVFAERGFHAANISHICAAARIGRGTLYQYFGNKKAVFAAILRNALDRVNEHIRVNRTPRFSPPEQLTRSMVIEWNARRLRELFAVVFDDENMLRILLREAVGLDVDVERLLSEIDDTLITMVASDIGRAQAAGIVRDLDARVIATLMVGGVQKLALRALLGSEAIDLDAMSRAVAELHGFGVIADRVRDDRPDV